jgi:hypothetical protein
LTTSLLELSRLDVPEATARRFLEVLVDLSIDDDGARGWPVIVRDTSLGDSGPSTVHTAAAVRTLARGRPASTTTGYGASRSQGRRGWSARPCSTWTTRPCASSGRTGGSRRPPLHPAVVLRAIVEARATSAVPGPRGPAPDAGLHVPALGLWRWPSSGGQFGLDDLSGDRRLAIVGLAHALGELLVSPV